MTVLPAKTQIGLGICPVWSESSLSAWRKLGSLATQWACSEDWSDWADAQADLSLRWTHSHFVGLWFICSLNKRKCMETIKTCGDCYWNQVCVYHNRDLPTTFEPRYEKTCLRDFPTRSDSNWSAQLQKLALGLKFWLQDLETLH